MRTLATIGILTLLSFSAQAQNMKGVITYDPLFWSKELNLNRQQQYQIQMINGNFFNDLQHFNCAVSGQCKSQLIIKLQNRSNDIWSVLSPKQKRALNKIMESYHQELTARISNELRTIRF